MSYPATNYIRFLIAKGGGSESYATVADTLDTYGFPVIAPVAFDTLQAMFTLPKNFQFTNKAHKPTAAFMKKQRISALWNPSKDEKQALDLLEQPHASEALRILLMGRVEPDQAAGEVSKRFGISPALSAKAVQTYAHYFWNVDCTGVQEWSKLLHDHPLRHHYMAALLCGPKQAMFRAGFKPTVEGKAALREAFRHLTFRIEATYMFPDSRETASMLGSMAKELKDLYNILFSEGAGLEEILREFRAFKMARHKLEVPSIQQLSSGGSHSGSGKVNGNGNTRLGGDSPPQDA